MHSPFSRVFWFAVAVLCGLGLNGATVHGATFIWSGSGNDSNWSTAANWAGNVAPPSDGTAVIVLADTNQLVANVDAAWTINSLTFSNNSGSFVLGGSGLSVRGGILNNSASTQTINNTITLSTNQTWTATGPLSFNGNINNNSYLLTLAGSSATTLSGVISGTGGLTKTGSGLSTLTGTNSYSGLTTVNAGVLNIQNNTALGSTAQGVTVASGAALQLQGGINVAGKTLNLSGTGISGSGALRNISGSNSWSGTITIGATCTIDADADTFSIGASILNSTFTVTFTNSGTILLSGAVGGGSGGLTGGLTKTGAGTLIINGTNTYIGPTTISGGVLQFGATGSSSVSSPVTVNAGGTLDLNSFNETIGSPAGAGNITLGNGILTLGNPSWTVFSGVISGAGGLVKVGAGTLTLSGANTYTGGTSINAGGISIAAATGLGSPTNSLTFNGGMLTTTASFASARAITLGTNGGIADVTSASTLTLSGTISGPGALTKSASGTLALSGTNTYLGGTTNSGGVLTISSDLALGDLGGSITMSNATLSTTAAFSTARPIFLNSGTNFLLINTGVTNIFSGAISGAGVVTKSGKGFLVLSGNNTFTNTFVISAGTLLCGSSGCLPASATVSISLSGAILNLNGFSETVGALAGPGKVTLGNGTLIAGGNNSGTAYSGVMSGAGSFTKMGTSMMVLSNANTYSGVTTVGAGTLQIGTSQSIANTSPLVVSSGGVFDLNNFNETVLSLSGGGNVTLGSGSLTAGNASNTVFSGIMSGTGAFTKIGTGLQVFSGTNSYSGATTVSAGNLQVNGSSTSSAVTLGSAATISGNGAVGTIVLNAGATNSPGTSAPGTLSSGSETWPSGGNYVWEINNPTGIKGLNWDWLNISGALNITANSGGKFNLKLASLTPANAAGQVTNFNNTVTYIWTIASASGGISGFNAANFNIDASAFQNSLGAGSFTLSTSGNDLNLIFTSAAQAAIKSVQSGTLVSSGNGTNAITLTTPVNPSNAFLIFNTRHNSILPGDSMVRGRIASSNSVEFARVTTGITPVNIQWYVAEYSAGVRVQSGEVNQTNTVINVPLSPISATNQAFIIWSKTPDILETAFSDSDPVVGQITSTSNLQFRVTSAPSSAPVISWQVIEFPNPASINVQTGAVTNMTGSNLQATATLGTPVDPNATVVLAGYRTTGSDTSIGTRMLRAQLTNANTIFFDRSISKGPLDNGANDVTEIAWQAVQFKDGSLVQSGSINFPNGLAETNVIFANSINTNRAIAFASVQPAGGQNTGRSPSTGSILGVSSATLAVNSTVQITLDRNNTSDQADIGWTVAALGPGSILALASGSSAISADTTGGTYTSLIGPVYTEIESGNVGTGTIILKAPTGFIFDTNATLPTVLVTRIAGSGANSLNINGVASGTSAAMTSVNQSNLTFTITSSSSGGVTCSLTWQNIRIRPAAGTPLASGSLVDIGTAVIQGVVANSTSWGFLTEVVGTPTKLAIATTPSSSVTAGVDLPQQPVIQIQDQFGNLCLANSTNVITATSSGTDTNNVSGSVIVVSGVATFSGMNYQVAQTNTITFSSPGLTSKTSGAIVVSAAAASQLILVTQPPSTAIAGASFVQQPVVQVQDQFGNLRKADNSVVVTASIDQGSGNLFGTQTATASSGVVTFTNLSYQIAETITIDFTANNLATATSTGVAVGAASASQLVIQTQPSSSANAGAPFAQQPVIQILDQFGNLCITNSAVVTASRDAASGSGTLQGTVNVAAVNGLVTFGNLTHKVAGTISVDFNSSGLPGATSSSISIIPASASTLAFSTQPGSATVGSIFGVQPSLVTQDVYGNRSSSGLISSQPATISLTSGAGALLGTTTLDIGTAAGNGTVAFANLEIDSAGGKQLTASASGLTSALSLTFNIGAGSQTISFGALSGKNYGDAPFNVSASASTGLPISFGIVSGPASVSGSNVTILGAGTVTISANQPGNADYTNATPVNQSFTVAKAVLTVTASNTTRVYGAGNPTFTAGYGGFVYTDNSSAISGTPTLSTTATTTNSVAGSPYPITATTGTLAASNYSFTFANGQLSVTPANSSLALLTSGNPSPTHSNVTFTATATAVSPGSGTPTGTIQFLADGTALGSPASLSGGVASYTTNSLSHGTHVITARYTGDGNFFGFTNTLGSNQVINTAPIAGGDVIQRYPNAGVKVRIATLLTNDSDADGDTLTFVSVNSTSTNGGTVTHIGNWIDYTPAAGFTNADTFSYVIADSGGLQATGLVSVITFVDNAAAQNAGSVDNLGNGSFLAHFSAIPARVYTIQAATNLVSPNWQSLGTATADAVGQLIYSDTPPTNSPPRFYRTAYP